MPEVSDELHLDDPRLATSSTPPFCTAPLPSQPMQSLEHIEGVAKRALLDIPQEAGPRNALTSLPLYVPSIVAKPHG